MSLLDPSILDDEHRWLAHFCLEPDLSETIEGFRKQLSSWGVGIKQQEFLLNLPPERLQTYRSLVRQTLAHTIRLAAPSAFNCLSELGDQLITQFLFEHGPKSRQLRFITEDFLNWLEEQVAQSPSLFDNRILDLLRLEQAELRSAAGQDETHKEFPEISPNTKLRLSRSSILLKLSSPVHSLENRARTLEQLKELAVVSSYVVVYRATDFRVKTLDLNASAYQVLIELETRETLAEAISAAYQQLSRPLDAAEVEKLANFLGEMSHRGIISRAD